MRRRTAVAVIAVSSLAIGSLSLARIATYRPEPPEPAPSPTVERPTPTRSMTPSPSPSRTGPPLAGLPPAVRRLAREVEEIRELRFVRPFTAKVLKPAQLARELRGRFEGETDEEALRASAQTLIHLGLLSADTDPVGSLQDLLVGAIAGIYFTADDVLYISSPDGTLSPSARFYGAHELAHALVDQHVDLGRLDEVDDPYQLDAKTAFSALAEGDATVVARRYFQRFTSAERATFQREISAAADPPASPLVYERGLEFPYEVGTPFVERLIEAGGWDAVTAAYRDPPASTEQVLHPWRYLQRDRPKTLDPPRLVAKVSIVEEGSFGEADLAITLDGDPALDTGVSRRDADRAALGWDGGAYRTIRARGKGAIIVSLAFDDAAERAEARTVIDRWLRARFGGRGGPVEIAGGEGWRGPGGRVAARRIVGGVLHLAIGTDLRLVRDLLARQAVRS